MKGVNRVKKNYPVLRNSPIFLMSNTCVPLRMPSKYRFQFSVDNRRQFFWDRAFLFFKVTSFLIGQILDRTY